MPEIRVRRREQQVGFRAPVFEYRPDWPYISVGYGGEREFFIENLALLIAAGMDVASALAGMEPAIKSWRMKKTLKQLRASVSLGQPLWKSIAQTGIYPERVISLIRAGEEAGRLPEHLNLVTVQQHKEKMLAARIRSAMLYPGVVLVLSFVLLLGGAWYVLPKLLPIYDQAQTMLPTQTRILLAVASFIQTNGILVIPATILLMGLIIYLLFVNRRTKFVGDWILLQLPGIRLLIQAVELSRLGYVFGALLQAGFQISDAMTSIQEGVSYRAYRKLYGHIKEQVEQGESFQKALMHYAHADRYIPTPIQQLIFAAEKSGRLPETFLRIGVIYEEKSDAMSKDVATVLEPIILIIVGLIVGFVVSAILGAYYGLVNVI